MSDSHSATVQRLIDMYIEKGDEPNATIAAVQLRGEALQEEEVARLVAKQTADGRYSDAVRTARSHHASLLVCDGIAHAACERKSLIHGFIGILSLDLSPWVRERLLWECSAKNVLINEGAEDFYKNLTDAERDELVLYHLGRTPLDLQRASEIALAGVSRTVLRKLFDALFTAAVMQIDVLIAVAKKLGSRAATTLLLSHFILKGMYGNALVTSQKLRNGKKLTKDEFEECLDNATANVLERGTFEESEELMIQLENASEVQRKNVCEKFLEAGRPLNAAQIAITITDIDDMIDLYDRCIQECIALEDVSPTELQTTVFRLVEQGCSDVVRANFFGALMATHDEECFKLARKEVTEGRLGLPEFNSLLEESVTYHVTQETPAFTAAYDLAKLSTEDSLLRINLRIIMNKLLDQATFEEPASLTHLRANLAFKIIAENEGKLTPNSDELKLLKQHFLFAHQLGEAIKISRWQGLPLTEDVLQQIIRDQSDQQPQSKVGHARGFG